jgi:hypothetical protein
MASCSANSSLFSGLRYAGKLDAIPASACKRKGSPSPLFFASNDNLVTGTADGVDDAAVVMSAKLEPICCRKTGFMNARMVGAAIQMDAQVRELVGCAKACRICLGDPYRSAADHILAFD